MVELIGPATSGLAGIIILVLFIYLITHLLKNRSEHQALSGSHRDHKSEKEAKILEKASKQKEKEYKKTQAEKKELTTAIRESSLYAKNEKAHGMKGAALMDKLAAKEDKASLDSVSIVQSLEGMQGRAIDMFSSLALLIKSLAYTDKNESIIEAQENDEQQALFQFTSNLAQLSNSSVNKTDITTAAIGQIDSYFEQLKAHFVEYADSYLIHSEDVIIHNIQFIKQYGLDELQHVILEAKHGQKMFKERTKLEKKDLHTERAIIGRAIDKKKKELGSKKLNESQRLQIEAQKRLLTNQGKILEQIENYMADAIKKIASHQSELSASVITIKSSDTKLNDTFKSFEVAYKKTLTKQLELRKSIHALSKEEHELKTQHSIEGAISVVAHALEVVKEKHDEMIRSETEHVFTKLEEFIQIAYQTCEQVQQFESRLQSIEQIESALTQAHAKMAQNIQKITTDDLSSVENDVGNTLNETKHLIDGDAQISSQMTQAKKYIEEQLTHLNAQFRMHQAELTRINQIYNQGIQNLNVLATQAMQHTTRFYEQQTNSLQR